MDTRLDRLSEPDFVREDDALGERRFESEQRSLDLVGIEVHGCVEQRHG
jgi:hypothetical protein